MLQAVATLDHERLAFLNEALTAAAAIEVAERLGVFARLAGGPVTPSTLAHDCAIGERGALLLLAALASLGLTDVNSAGAYRLTLANPVRLTARFTNLAQVIRDDKPQVSVDTPGGAESFYPAVTPLLGAMLASAAKEAAQYLTAPGLRVLDVGAGAAPWSLALAACDPACRICALDLPSVLPTTRRAVEAAGYAAQFEYLSDDLFNIEWGASAYDLVIAGNICHLFGEAANQWLLGLVVEALCPTGKLVIIDALPDEQMNGPRSVTLYALDLMLRTQTGRVYPLSTYASWLRAAGFKAVERIDLAAMPLLSLVIAQRPAQTEHEHSVAWRS
jgi:ubiquinone/menaquinone biosynthesis C-methylase UbiE